MIIESIPYLPPTKTQGLQIASLRFESEFFQTLQASPDGA